MSRLHTQPKAKVDESKSARLDVVGTRGDILPTKRALVIELRTPLATLLALREAWLDDDLERHIAISGQLLGQLAHRPWYAASTMLDAAVLVARRLGMDGIVPVALTCLSSAYILAPGAASKAADEFALSLMDADGLKLQRRGIHLFLDLEQMAHKALHEVINNLILNSRPSKHPSHIEGMGDPFGDARLGGVESMIKSLQKKGAFVPIAILSALGDRPHDQLLNIVKYKPKGDPALWGFGPAIRQASANDPWYQWKEPGVGHVSSGNGLWDAIASTAKAWGQKSGRDLMFANVTTDKGKTYVIGVDTKTGKPDGLIPQDPITAVSYIAPTSMIMTSPGWVSAPSTPDTKIKMPLPDDVGGDDFPAILGQFAAQGLLPWTIPVDNAGGPGPAVLRFSDPSVTNPGPDGTSGGPITDVDAQAALNRMILEVIRLVNPIAFLPSDALGRIPQP